MVSIYDKYIILIKIENNCNFLKIEIQYEVYLNIINLKQMNT